MAILRCHKTFSVVTFFNAFPLENRQKGCNFAAQNEEIITVIIYIYLRNNEKTEIFPDGSGRARIVLLQ